MGSIAAWKSEKKESVNWETDQKLPKMNHREKTDCIKQEQSLRDRWDYNKRSNIPVIRVLGQEKEDEVKKVPEEIMAKKLSKFSNRHKATESRR